MTTRPQASTLPTGAQTPVRVLVVDDDELLGDSLATALESLGHRVRIAHTAGPLAPGHPVPHKPVDNASVTTISLPLSHLMASGANPSNPNTDRQWSGI